MVLSRFICGLFSSCLLQAMIVIKERMSGKKIYRRVLAQCREDCQAQRFNTASAFIGFGGIMGTIGGNRFYVLIFWYLFEQFRPHGGTTHIVNCDFDSPSSQYFLVDAYIYLAPDLFFGATMLTRVPLTFRLNASSVDKKVQRATAAAIG